jgi:hypothetical protein
LDRYARDLIAARHRIPVLGLGMGSARTLPAAPDSLGYGCT